MRGHFVQCPNVKYVFQDLQGYIIPLIKASESSILEENIYYFK